MRKLLLLIFCLTFLLGAGTSVAHPHKRPHLVRRPVLVHHHRHRFGLITVNVGTVLHAHPGTWTNQPQDFAYQWQACDDQGTTCQDITGAIGDTYTIALSDVGHTIRLQVTASNVFGQTTTFSNVTTVVPAPTPTVPSAFTVPEISGLPLVGQTLSTTDGIWSAFPNPTFTYQWQTCSPTCVNIGGATNNTYTVQNSDVGSTLRAEITATNSAGSTIADSAQSNPADYFNFGGTGTPIKVWIHGGWYWDGLPTNPDCAIGAGGTASGNPCWFNYQNGFATSITTEFAPYLVSNQTNPTTPYQYLLTSASSYFCSSTHTLIDALDPNRAIDCRDPAHNTLVTQDDSHYNSSSSISATDYSTRNYFGAATGAVVTNSGNQYIVGAAHGENKNEQLWADTFQNTVAPSQLATECVQVDAGIVPIGNCQHFDAGDTCPQDLPSFTTDTPDELCSYFGFINGTNSPALNSGNNYGTTPWTNLGPIVWPRAGYVDSGGIPQSRGVRHPFIFQPGDGYLYLYYLDTTPSDWGIKVARSPESSLGAIGSWMVYDAGTGLFDLSATPMGMDNSNYSTYFSTPGPSVDNLWNNDGPQTVPLSFEVAKLTGLPGWQYIGLETRFTTDTATPGNPAAGWPNLNEYSECVAVRLSNDLVNWTPPKCVPQSDNHWYPVPLSSDGTTMTTVAASSFYLSDTNGSIPYLQNVSLVH